ncbi:MAG TPA: hypothetical protein VN764_12945 [Polyangiaceae bacterium]|nr:hypothetical protein [Polyangiaceae bacterium]
MVIRALTIIVFLMLIPAGCGFLEPRSLPPECRDEALAQLEAYYVQDVMLACEGQDFDECDARVPIEAHYAQLREEWISCRR